MSDHDFNTPPWILDLIRQLGPICLDPCSNPWSMVGAPHSYTIIENGLITPWRGYGLVFVNPPHSISPHHIEPWIDKALEEFGEKPTRWDTPQDSLITLIPAKPDTDWFHRFVPQCDARCFLKGRPRYWQHGVEMPGPGKFASMLTYTGPATGRFMSIFEPYGWIV